MVAGVEISGPPIEVRLLGALRIDRNGIPMPLPASRKVRALFGWLALAPRPVARETLCDLLWDAPSDPRGELRWCLSKIRGLVDAPGKRRLLSEDDRVWLDLSDDFVDAVEVARSAESGLEGLAPERRRALAQLFAGDFLEGLALSGHPAYAGWLTAQRRRFGGLQIRLLADLVRDAADEDERLRHLEQWLQVAPLDRDAHERLLETLARLGRIREGEAQLAAAARLFDAEGLDSSPLRATWQAARAASIDLPQAPPMASEPRALGAPDTNDEPGPGLAAHRASIAVMPFVDGSPEPEARGGLADALAHDVITRLAKLRSLFVIAPGTVFALHERAIPPDRAGRMLEVEYVVGGTVRRSDARLLVAVELADTRTGRIVWAETFSHRADDALLVLDAIGDRIVASIASEVEALERDRAILKPPDSLNAWEAHHRGLWHMYRFNKADNERARHFFETALRLDPSFARAHAGLSFTHFQDAFQGWSEREPGIELAYASANDSLMADDRDPAAHWAMGRALWLRGRHEPAIGELEQAVELSPNFALAHYTLAFIHSQDGDPAAAIAASDHSRHLSPFDPLLFGMLGARAMALVRLGRFDEAARWAVKAAARPNAHPHIQAIAAFALALAGSLDEARAQAEAIRRALPAYRFADFLAAFQFDAQGAALFRKGARRIGMG